MPVLTDCAFIADVINFLVELHENLVCLQWVDWVKCWYCFSLLFFYLLLFSLLLFLCQLEHLNVFCLWVSFVAHYCLGLSFFIPYPQDSGRLLVSLAEKWHSFWERCRSQMIDAVLSSKLIWSFYRNGSVSSVVRMLSMSAIHLISTYLSFFLHPLSVISCLWSKS